MANTNEFNGFTGKFVVTFVVPSRDLEQIKDDGIIWFSVVLGHNLHREDEGFSLTCANQAQEDLFEGFSREELSVIACVPVTQTVTNRQGKPVARPVTNPKDILGIAQFPEYITVLRKDGEALEIGVSATKALHRSLGFDQAIKAWYEAHPIEKGEKS